MKPHLGKKRCVARSTRDLFLALLFVLSVACLPVFGQVGPDAPPKMPPPNNRLPPPPPPQPKASPRTEEGERARGLFVTRRSDAMSVLVLKNERGKLVPVDPANTFKAGDLIKLQIESNFDGFIYVVNIEPSGRQCLRFPYPQVPNNAVKTGDRYEIPPGLDSLQFDQQKGIEILQVIMSRNRIALLDAALREPEGCFAQSTPPVIATTQTGIVKNVTPALSQYDTSKRGSASAGERGLKIKVGATRSERLRSRDILLAPGKNKDPKGSVVAVSDVGAGGKLKSGDVALFEIHLKHN